MSGTLNIITGTINVTVITATSQADPTVYATVTDTTIAGPDVYRLLLPLVLREKPLFAKLAVDFGHLFTDTELLEYDVPLVKEMGASWVRIYLPWARIEKSPGEYDWAPYDAVFERLIEFGLEPLPIVYGAPAWAAEASCGPISDTLAFEGFLEVVLARYGSYADAWEFTNEPDGRNPHPWGPIIGCWGPRPDAYASQLGIFYRKVKTLDPGALVVYGGLAYDNWVLFDRNFFQETLQNGAGPVFDVANVHYYPGNYVDFPTLAYKVNEIRDIMAKNGVYGKRIWVTETGMGVNPPYGTLEAQRDFIVRELTRGFGAGVDNIFWFAVREGPVESPLHRWLVNRQHEPDNGYYTFQHLANKLEGASFIRRYQDVPADVEAYWFAAPGRSLYILWSNSVPQTVAIPAWTNAILTNRDGDASRLILVQNGQVSFEVSTEPVFLEITPTGLRHYQP
jgi:hypothetical protein